jgi:hypothetical protein
MTVPAEIARLVETFERNRQSYAQGRYSETQLRREYVDPFFKALGWDVDSTRGRVETYKDVIDEDAIRIGSAVKAPAYCFRIGGTRKFFVEANAPEGNLKDDPEPAHQLRRYAWSARLPLSILTNFEEFAVYDCRVRPRQADPASKARTKYWRYTDYGDRWDEIVSIFAYDAVLGGSFDEYVTSVKRLRGSAEVDAAFLAEIETWRESLAHRIALRNPALTDHQLNYAVQITIDRVIFLRICEDRGIERYGQLLSLLNGSDVYRRLVALFRQADDRYNSGLFHFLPEKDRPESPDELTPDLIVDDKPLKDILRSLYYPESPYEFSVLPAEILGRVHEQFLGKVITLTAGHHARVEDKPEVKKAGGVFYTPAHIVDYVVKQTVGRLLEGRTVTFYKTKPPKLDRPLRVLDPACGSGSFLLGAYQLLLDWHRAHYEQHDPEAWAAAKFPPIYQAGVRGWQLTPTERTRILLDHIFGVDIDPRAMEVTKLSLLLRVLEDEENLVPFHHERALPRLTGNVKCGNSLIGPDFYQGRQRTAFDEGERFRINAFDWHAQFPEVFQDGGVDAVIGNPPWGQKGIHPDSTIQGYLREKYVSLAGILDIFRPFVEQSIRLLTPGGLFGMVLPDVVLLKDYPDTRLFMLKNLALNDIRWWGTAFANAVIDAVTIVARKDRAPDGQLVEVRIEDRDRPLQHNIPQSDFLANPRYTFNLYLTRPKRAILESLGSLPKLGDFFEIHEGVHSGNMRAELFVPSALDNTCRPLYFGREEIVPYGLRWKGRYVRLGAIPKRRDGRTYAHVGRREWHERPKVLVRRTGDHVRAAADEEGHYASNNFFLVLPRRRCSLDLHGLCALLNSRFMTWYFRCIEPRQGRVFAELKIKHLSIFPLPGVIETPRACQELNGLGHQRMVETRHLADAFAPHASERRRRALCTIDDLIDECVLALVGVKQSQWFDGGA